MEIQGDRALDGFVRDMTSDDERSEAEDKEDGSELRDHIRTYLDHWMRIQNGFGMLPPC